MMNKRIRSMVDEIFSEMKMTAENLALRDELMANAQARYEDSVAQGKSEEEAFVEVAASLEDVCGLLEEMKRMDEQQSGDAPQEETVPELKTGTEPEEAGETEDEEAGKDAGEHAGEAPQTDLGDALNKAFTALGDFGQAIMPEAKKLYGQMDDVTGGVLGKLGRAARKGMRDAQKAAEEAIEKFAGEDGELVFDFGANKEAAPQETEQETEQEPQESDTPENDLEDAMEDARREAERSAREAAGEADGEDAQEPAEETGPETDGETAQEPLADSEPDEEAFSRAVDEMTREAEEVIHQAAKAARDAAEGAAEYVVRDAGEPVSGRQTFPAAGLHKIDIQLDADDVEIVPADGTQVETLWEAKSADGEPVITMSGHTLTIRRKNPDVFKTFFSVFQKAGGRITVRVPRGYAAGYAITTTSGDVRIGELDLDDVKVTTTSGSVRVEPDAKTRAGDIAVTTVSGHATVSACADTIGVTTVSGGQFISCDAHKVDVNVVSGRVHVEGACDEWEVSAVSSDVELLCTVAPTKKVQISSVHGDVRLALPGDIRGFVAESSGALGCEIINEFGPNRYGTCGLPIRMETMRGKLIITRL
ncbi:MAG: DUF4097 family beta strand repeat protein [Clostridia bacterium]|nr:DUF4097 family beta strand repeat protein [Clostridia bacterium]